MMVRNIAAPARVSHQRTPVTRTSRGKLIVALLSALAWTVPSPVAAQAPTPVGNKQISLFTRDDAYLAAFFIAGTFALAPFDKKLAGDLQQPNTQANRTFQSLATGVRVIADPGSVIIGTSMYIIGRVGHWQKVADLGLHGEEAILVGTILTTGIKWTAGRARPYTTADTNPRDYQLLRGLRKGRDYASFPSGHTLAAFSAAAAVTNETSRWWPGSQWYIGPLMFGGATAVGLSRMYNNQHWASDVILGAGIGTFAGNKVVRFAHRTNPGNRFDRWLLGATVAPSADGLVFSWSLAPAMLR